MNSPTDIARMQAPNVMSTWTPDGQQQQQPRQLRTWFAVTFGPPRLTPPPVPFYPDESIPRFGQVFVEANRHLIDAAHFMKPAS